MQEENIHTEGSLFESRSIEPEAELDEYLPQIKKNQKIEENNSTADGMLEEEINEKK